MQAVAVPLQMKAFHAQSVREFCEEFPDRKERLERLIREKKIVVIDEQPMEKNHVNKIV